MKTLKIGRIKIFRQIELNPFAGKKCAEIIGVNSFNLSCERQFIRANGGANDSQFQETCVGKFKLTQKSPNHLMQMKKKNNEEKNHILGHAKCTHSSGTRERFGVQSRKKQNREEARSSQTPTTADGFRASKT